MEGCGGRYVFFDVISPAPGSRMKPVGGRIAGGRILGCEGQLKDNHLFLSAIIHP